MNQASCQLNRSAFTVKRLRAYWKNNMQLTRQHLSLRGASSKRTARSEHRKKSGSRSIAIEHGRYYWA